VERKRRSRAWILQSAPQAGLTSQYEAPSYVLVLNYNASGADARRPIRTRSGAAIPVALLGNRHDLQGCRQRRCIVRFPGPLVSSGFDFVKSFAFGFAEPPVVAPDAGVPGPAELSDTFGSCSPKPLPNGPVPPPEGTEIRSLYSFRR
jgi:hypothetical protein